MTTSFLYVCRFHPLQEFDEGKRSCRRRLAGHNKRRRKSNIDVNGANGLNVLVGSADNTAQPGNAELLSIITLLSQFQGEWLGYLDIYK